MLEQMGIDPSKGLLQAYEEDFAPSMARQKAATVKGDIDILREYGPQLLQAQRDIDPLADSLRQGIMDSASEDMAAGMGLTETEQRDLRPADSKWCGRARHGRTGFYLCRHGQPKTLR